METATSEIMTIEEAAAYLRIPVSTLYRLAQLGRVPAAKVGRHWRFHRQTLGDWITAQSMAGEGIKVEAAKVNP